MDNCICESEDSEICFYCIEKQKDELEWFINSVVSESGERFTNEEEMIYCLTQRKIIEIENTLIEYFGSGFLSKEDIEKIREVVVFLKTKNFMSYMMKEKK